jgi:hypothetical protein
LCECGRIRDLGGQEIGQVLLGPTRLGEDDGFLLRAEFIETAEGDAERLQQGAALGVLGDGFRLISKAVERFTLGAECCAAGWAVILNLVFVPFVAQFVEMLDVRVASSGSSTWPRPAMLRCVGSLTGSGAWNRKPRSSN